MFAFGHDHAEADRKTVAQRHRRAQRPIFVAIYGGYFGGGIGILMLAALTLYGLRDILLMNSLKIALATLMNLTATGVFLFSGKITGWRRLSWRSARSAAVFSAPMRGRG